VKDFDLVVVGGGSGGFAAAIAAAELGKRVAIANTGPLGGTCTNHGCIPSKTLIRAADDWHRAGRSLFAGVHTARVRLDWKELQAQKDRLIDDLRQKSYWDVLDAYPGMTLLEGEARFTGDGAGVGVRVGERTYRAEKYVVATGSRPRIVDFPGIEDAEPLTSTTLMELDHLPESLIVLGGRAVALELGQMMARFGTRVTILQRSDRLVPEHEPEIGEAIREYVAEDGIDVVTGVEVERLGRGVVYASGREYRAERILLALGRQANTERLGLDAAGIETTSGGAIRVDEFLRTTNPDVYAVGDVTPVPEYVYVAAAGGTLAGRNAFSGTPAAFDLDVVPGVIFTEPQIATVGLTEAAARAAGYDVRTSTVPMAYVPSAQVTHNPCGLYKLVADRATDRILGAHVVAPHAGEVIQAATLAVKSGLTVGDLVGTLFAYLTDAEGLRLAAVSFDKDLDKLSCCV
jgi:mercuric reductase